MKTLIALLLIAFSLVSAASDNLPFTNMVSDLNSAWSATNYAKMDRIFQEALASESSRPYALAAILHFYVFDKPNYAKANKYADEFLKFVTERGNAEEIEAAKAIIQDIKNIPDSEYGEFSPEQRSMIRRELGQYFINPIALGIVHKLLKEESSNKGLLRTGDPRTSRQSAEP